MPKPDVYIYLDEFERGTTFVLSALFVPVDIASQLTADWDALRKEIKQFLLANYPDAPNHPFLHGNLLPEVHTVDLFQSKGYYRKYRRGQENRDDRYWLQHYAWIEQGLELISKYDLRFVPFVIHKDQYIGVSQSVTSTINKIFDQIDEWPFPTGRPKPLYSRTKALRLASNKYLLTLSQVLNLSEAYLKSQNLFGEIICDDHEMSKGFSTTRVIDWLRQNGTYTALEKPRFASGLDESLLQACDVLCYVAGQSAYAMHNTQVLKEPLNGWISKYGAGILDSFFDLEVESAHSVIILFELISELCIYDVDVKDETIKILRELYKELY